jgi:3'-phosphoadenosine 5'-phosphosulfate sulfotransferase (PAPS reductase)/FAD synthetase
MELYQLRQFQSLPLEAKIIMSQRRIREWYEHWGGEVYVSFSGDKDSTVLLHLVRSIYPDVPAVFVDTGLEYPEIREFVKTVNNVVWLKPKMTFQEVIEKYGYPVISKETAEGIRRLTTMNLSEKYKNRLLYGGEKGAGKIAFKWQYLQRAPFRLSGQCCDVIKKRPTKRYSKEAGKTPILGTLAGEGSLRLQQYLRRGCNTFDSKNPKSAPLSFWMESDIWQYLHTYNVPYSKIYDMGYTRTGCMFCMFGVHLEERPNRFERMKYTHPHQWEYCMFKLGLADVLDYIGVEWGGQMEIRDYL